MNTLAVRRSSGQSVVLSYPGGNIEVTVAGVDGMTGQATVVFVAADNITITRKEILNRASGGERNK